jgi:hypothetical protein
VRCFSLTDVTQHHRCAQYDRGRIGDVLSGYVGRRAMNGLEDCDVIPDIRGRREAEAASQP